jgi:NTE family protein
LQDTLASNRLFTGISSPALASFAVHARQVDFAPGEVVMCEGDKGDSLFLVMSGLLKVLIARPGREPGIVAELGAGETVGEIAVLTGDRRAASVIAEEHSRLLELPRKAFEATLADHPAEVAKVLSKVLETVERRQLSTALHRNQIFASLPLHVLRDLADELQDHFVAGGEILFHQGDSGDALYLVVSGRLHILRETADGISVIGELGPGETVGEIAILGGERRLATAIAVRDTQLAALSKEGFHRILEKYPLVAAPFFARQLVAIASRPIRSESSSSRARSVAVAGVSPHFDLSAFSRSLARALGRHHRVLHLTSRAVGEALGEDMAQMLDWDPRHRNLLVWLSNKEQEYDCVLYETDATQTPWTERCLRQADRILLVADAAVTRDLTPADMYRTQSGRQALSLALVHAEGQEPSGTAGWLGKYPVAQHHHLRLKCQSDFERLARFVTGRAIGVALGGGFARGVAHAGILRAMRELEIPIDAIGGTSMGALIALQYLYGYTWEQMVDTTCQGGSESLHDWTLPLVALFHGKRVRKFIASRTFGKRMEDLWLPCFAVATNLTTAKIEVLRDGPVDEAILASSRVPGMLPPIVRGRDLLVDGGLMSNVPADVMKSFGVGTIISVDVSSKVDFAAVRSEHSDVSGWKVLFDRLRGGVELEQTPTIISVLMRTMELDTESYRQRMKSLSDLYLMPPVTHYRFNDFKHGRQMAEEAHRYAYAELERWNAHRKAATDSDTLAIDEVLDRYVEANAG